jgi:hypothetical protein
VPPCNTADSALNVLRARGKPPFGAVCPIASVIATRDAPVVSALAEAACLFRKALRL